jgi:hypothetical protein
MIIDCNSLPLVGSRREPFESPKAVLQEGIPNGSSVDAERTGYPVSTGVNDNPPQRLPSSAKCCGEVSDSRCAALLNPEPACLWMIQR